MDDIFQSNHYETNYQNYSPLHINNHISNKYNNNYNKNNVKSLSKLEKKKKKSAIIKHNSKYINIGQNIENAKAESVGSKTDRIRDACRSSCIKELVNVVQSTNLDTYPKLIWFIFKLGCVDILYKQKIKNMPNRNDSDLCKIILQLSKNMDNEYKAAIEKLIKSPIDQMLKLSCNIKLINESVTNLVDNF